MAEEVRTLWIGNLQYWVDESYLNQCFAHTGEVISIKIIRNQITGQPAGYGFVEFTSRAAAERILQTYNGIQMPGTELTFRLNWAFYATGVRRPDAAPEHPVFLWNLAYEVTDYLLKETFRMRYPSVMSARVVTDPNTGHSMGYGFVNFVNENERNRARVEMNGVCCLTRPMCIGEAMPRKPISVHQQYSLVPSYSTPVPVLPADYDANNTTDLATRGQQVDPNQWNAYYEYGGAYDAYGSRVVQDPSLYAYGAYSGYASYPQQVDAVQDLAAVAGAAPVVEQGDEWNDTLDTPDVDHLNDAYLSKHESAILGRPLWLTTSSLARQT